jgi:hypothetical protein
LAISVKDTTKRDLKIKEAQIVNDKFYIDGEEQDLISLLHKVFEDNLSFEITATVKNENNVDMSEDDISSDEE